MSLSLTLVKCLKSSGNSQDVVSSEVVVIIVASIFFKLNGSARDVFRFGV